MNSLKSCRQNTFSLISLGCSKNQVDSEVMIYQLESKNYRMVDISQNPGIIIINTCGFIQDAKEESIRCILETSISARDSILVVAGCLSELYKDQLKKEIPEIDIIAGTNESSEIAGIIDSYIKTGRRYFIRGCPHHGEYSKYHKRVLLEDSAVYAYIKIAEGCSRNCSFCVIPLIKGKFRSKPLNIICDEILSLMEHPVWEFNLISQDTMFYGRDLYRKESVLTLVNAISRLKGDFFCRLMYMNPANISGDFIKTIRDSERFINYFDIPVQHFSDSILKSMNRGYRGKEIYNTIGLIRDIIPDAVIRTTVMTGFPGETEEDFNILLKGIENIEFDRLGCFVYSDEEFSKSYLLSNKVLESKSKSRFRRIMLKQRKIHHRKIKSKIGSIQKGIISHNDKRLLIQSPEVDGELFLEDDITVSPGIYDILVTGVTEYDFIGRIND